MQAFLIETVRLSGAKSKVIAGDIHVGELVVRESICLHVQGADVIAFEGWKPGLIRLATWTVLLLGIGP